MVRQGLALRHRSLYDRLRAIAEYDYTRRPDTVLVLTPRVWEERLTTRFCEERNLRDCYVAVESREALERRNLRLWCSTSWVIGSRFFSLEGVVSRASPGGGPRSQSPERKRASLPRPERMVRSAPAFGISPSEKRTLELITDHPMIAREHLALWLGVSEGRVSQMMHSLVNTWSLVERRGQRGHPLRIVRRGHSVRHPPGPRPAPHHTGHLEHRPDHRPPGPEAARGPPHRDMGATDEARRRHHLVPLEAGGRGQGRPRQRAAMVRPHRQVRPGRQLVSLFRFFRLVLFTNIRPPRTPVVCTCISLRWSGQSPPLPSAGPGEGTAFPGSWSPR